MLKNIKSQFILKALFDKVGIYKSLLLSHGNKYLNIIMNNLISINSFFLLYIYLYIYGFKKEFYINKLEITSKNYKDAYENIEISLKLSDDAEDYKEKENRFIFIHMDLPKDGFEIYLDNKLTDSQYVTKDNKVSNVLIRIKPKIDTLQNLFQNCTCIKEINIINCVRKDIVNMSYMFYGCSSLRSLDISRLRTNNVTDMSYMLCECSLLKEIKVSNFDTSKVKNMEAMFKSCKSLKKLDASNFLTKEVTNFSEMFYEDTDLTDLNVKNFFIDNACFMDKMFYGCSSLTNIELFPLNFSATVDKTEMTKGCPYFNDKNIA